MQETFPTTQMFQFLWLLHFFDKLWRYFPWSASSAAWDLWGSRACSPDPFLRWSRLCPPFLKNTSSKCFYDALRPNSWTFLGQSLKRFPPCYSQSTLLTDFTPSPDQKGFKTVCNVNIVYGNLKSENFQDYAQKPQRNCTFINSASVLANKLFVLSMNFSVPTAAPKCQTYTETQKKIQKDKTGLNWLHITHYGRWSSKFD
jgi:hypothetical protein